MRVDLVKNQSPFETTSTKILRPTLNNERIVAQAGWFTAHRYSKADNQFVALEKNINIKSHLTQIEIPATLKKELLRKFSMFGINNQTIFPDINGLSLHLNWKYLVNKY